MCSGARKISSQNTDAGRLAGVLKTQATLRDVTVHVVVPSVGEGIVGVDLHPCSPCRSTWTVTSPRVAWVLDTSARRPASVWRDETFLAPEQIQSPP
jgi:hypothetical protein